MGDAGFPSSIWREELKEVEISQIRDVMSAQGGKESQPLVHWVALEALCCCHTARCWKSPACPHALSISMAHVCSGKSYSRAAQ